MLLLCSLRPLRFFRSKCAFLSRSTLAMRTRSEAVFPLWQSRCQRLSGFAVSGTASPHCAGRLRSEEHTSELQSLMRISYAVFCLKKKKKKQNDNNHTENT